MVNDPFPEAVPFRLWSDIPSADERTDNLIGRRVTSIVFGFAPVLISTATGASAGDSLPTPMLIAAPFTAQLAPTRPCGAPPTVALAAEKRAPLPSDFSPPPVIETQGAAPGCER